MPVYTTHEQIEIDRLLDLARDLLTGGYVPDHLVPPVVHFLATGDIGYFDDYDQCEVEWNTNRKDPAIQFVRALWLLAPVDSGYTIEQRYVDGNAKTVRTIRELMEAHDQQKKQTQPQHYNDETSPPDY